MNHLGKVRCHFLAKWQLFMEYEGAALNSYGRNLPVRLPSLLLPGMTSMPSTCCNHLQRFSTQAAFRAKVFQRSLLVRGLPLRTQFYPSQTIAGYVEHFSSNFSSECQSDNSSEVIQSNGESFLQQVGQCSNSNDLYELIRRQHRREATDELKIALSHALSFVLPDQHDNAHHISANETARSEYNLETIIPAISQQIPLLTMKEKLLFFTILKCFDWTKVRQICTSLDLCLRSQITELDIDELTLYLNNLVHIVEDGHPLHKHIAFLDDGEISDSVLSLLKHFLDKGCNKEQLAECLYAYVMVGLNPREKPIPNLIQHLHNSLDDLSIKGAISLINTGLQICKPNHRHSVYSGVGIQLLQDRFADITCLSDLARLSPVFSLTSNKVQENVVRLFESLVHVPDEHLDTTMLTQLHKSLLKFRDISHKKRILHGIDLIICQSRFENDVFLLADFLGSCDKFGICISSEEELMKKIVGVYPRLQCSKAVVRVLTLFLKGNKLGNLPGYEDKLISVLDGVSIDGMVALFEIYSDLEPYGKTPLLNKISERILAILIKTDAQSLQKLRRIRILENINQDILKTKHNHLLVNDKLVEYLLMVINPLGFCRGLSALHRFFTDLDLKKIPPSVWDRTRNFLPQLSPNSIFIVLSIVARLKFVFETPNWYENEGIHKLWLEIFHQVLEKTPPSHMLKNRPVNASLTPSKVTEIPASSNKYLKNRNSATQIAFFLGSVGLYYSDILDAAIENLLDNPDERTAERLAWLIPKMAKLNHHNLPRLNEVLDVFISNLSHLSLNHILSVVYCLAVLGHFNEVLLRTVFSIQFLEDLDKTASPRIKALLKGLNRAVCLEHPALQIPWFLNSDYLQAAFASESRTMNGRGREIYHYLQKYLGGAKFIAVNTRAPYDYFIDFEFCVDVHTKQPVPYFAMAGVNSPNFQKENSIQRIAVDIIRSRDFCINVPRLKGVPEMKKRHLEILGYNYVIIPRNDWCRRSLPTDLAKFDYITGKLQGLVCNIRSEEEEDNDGYHRRQYQENGQSSSGITDDEIIDRILKRMDKENF